MVLKLFYCARNYIYIRSFVVNVNKICFSVRFADFSVVQMTRETLLGPLPIDEHNRGEVSQSNLTAEGRGGG